MIPGKFTMKLEIDETVARQFLQAECVCYGEGMLGLPINVLKAIRRHFPEIAKEYHYLPAYDKE